MSTPKKEKNIYQRLMAITSKLGTIDKDTDVKLKAGGYKAVSHDAVTEKLAPLCIEEGVQIIPDVTDYQQINDITALKVQITYQNVDDPADKLVVHAVGYGQDFGDKGPGKALSYAVKATNLKIFMAKTGENDEHRIETENTWHKGKDAKSPPPQQARPAGQNLGKEKPISEKQQKFLQYTLTKKSGWTMNEVVEYCDLKFGDSARDWQKITMNQFDILKVDMESGVPAEEVLDQLRFERDNAAYQNPEGFNQDFQEPYNG